MKFNFTEKNAANTLAQFVSNKNDDCGNFTSQMNAMINGVVAINSRVVPNLSKIKYVVVHSREMAMAAEVNAIHGTSVYVHNARFVNVDHSELIEAGKSQASTRYGIVA